MKKDLLRFKYTVSKAPGTYGYNIVSLYVNGIKRHYCMGGGYDMRGTCVAEYLELNYMERVRQLTTNYGSEDGANGYYGLRFYFYNEDEKKYQQRNTFGGIEATTHLDGACGIGSMWEIAEAIGLSVERVENDIYLITDNA